MKDHGLPVISAVTGSPVVTAFFHDGGRGTGREMSGGVVGMRGGFVSALMANGASAAGADVSRIALVTIVVVAVAAFTVLQVIARSRGARELGRPDWPS